MKDDEEPSSRDDWAPEIEQYPEGSLEQSSPSLRHMAANPYTFEGQVERRYADASMARLPGWRGRVLRIGALSALLIVVAILAANIFIH